ncbi:hypothetical protein [Flocculibacter collagenilyticus]|uniref:hypothetical protein n=1 Tax=Flocculibacter collagenilyticus TaxID=2744479 RepID=UPI0018F42E50|nr:hypothetical protein [Flocculibacter collagenilyticus]
MHQLRFAKWPLLSISLILALAGIFQIGKLIGLAVYSSDFSLNSISIWQVGLISSGIWGISEFTRTIKKLKKSPQYS